MAKVVINEPIPDLSIPWENYTGQRVEDLIKKYLGDHDRKKIGHIILPKSLGSDGFYHIQCFASKESYELWKKDEEINSGLLLFDLPIPIVEDNGTTYSARILTSLVSSDPIISTKKDYVVPIMYRGTMSSGGVTENVGINATVTIERSTNGGSSWETVGTTTLISMDQESTNYTDINIGKYFSDTNPQQIRLRASYVVTDDDGNVVASPQSAWLTFSNITYTNLSISFAGTPEIPIDGTKGGLSLAYNFSGEILRTLHIKIFTKTSYYEITRTLQATEYTNALTTWKSTVTDDEGVGILDHGIHTIEAWLTCSDGVNSDGISSDHTINQILVINPNTPGADLQKTWFLIQNVKKVVTNYVAVPEFFKYSVWVPSPNDPLISIEDEVEVSFVLTDYGTNGVNWTTEYFRVEQLIKSGVSYTLPVTVEIENSTEDMLFSYLHVLDGEGNNFLSDRNSYTVSVDNTEKFAPIEGSDFLLNPKNRNNSESDPFTIINAVTGNIVNSEFSDNFDALSDLWVTSSDDNQKVLRIKAGQKLIINYDWLSPFRNNPNADVTLELDFKIKNVTDEESPIIQALETVGSNFIGLKMSPMYGLIYSRSNIVNESQDFRWQEGERTHIAINIVSAVRPTVDSPTTLPLCRVFINGVINREFLFGIYNSSSGSYEVNSGEWYQNGSSIVLGQDMADLDIYSIRCYKNVGLTSSNILQNYISTLPTSDLKLKVRSDNSILGGNGLISADLLKSKGRNVLIWHGKQPYYYESDVSRGWWEIHRYSADGKEDLDHSGTICKETKCLNPTRQGTTANTYYYSNIQTKLKDITKGTKEDKDAYKIFIPLNKIHKSYSYKEEDIITVEGVEGIKDYDGWFDGNDLYHGPYYQIDESCPAGQKMVLKINYASCMQSHLMGGCRMYNDLHTSIVGKNSLQEKDSRARVAKYQDIFHYFTQGESETVPVYQGPGTFGPGKMDDLTWGYKKDEMFCMMEGADNNLPLTDFRIPWDSSRIFYEKDGTEVAGFIYNGATSLDLDKFKAVEREVSVYVNETNVSREILEAPSVEVEQKIKEFVNFLYFHNPGILYYPGKFENFKKEAKQEGTSINEAKFYWCTDGDDKYCLKRYDVVDKEWVDAGWDVENEKVVKRDLSVDSVTASAFIGDVNGQWDTINTRIINKIAEDARINIGSCINKKSALFHYSFVNQFLAGTDNCSKNTYYVLDPVTLLWELHQDDVDTIFATDNSGFQSKPYYIDRQNPYPDGSIRTCYEGGNNVLFNLIEAAFESNGEIKNMMRDIFTGMCNLITSNDTDLSHTPWGALQKYFFSTQDYLSAVAYNEAARIRYEYPSTLGFRSSRGVDPISQSMGDQKESEKQYMKRRLVLFASYAEWGTDFSWSSSGNLGLSESSVKLGFEASNGINNEKLDVNFTLIPHQYIYPTGYAGTTTLSLNKRCKPGESYNFPISSDYIDGDTVSALCAANYYRNFGNLGDLSVPATRSIEIKGNRLVEFIAKPSDPSKPQFRPPTFSITAPLIEKLSLENCSWIGGSLDLRNCTRLKTINLKNTRISEVTFPETSTLTEIYLPGTITRLTISRLPKLTLHSLNIAGFNSLLELSLSSIPNIDVYTLIGNIKAANPPLNSVYITDINWKNIPSFEILDYLSGIRNSNLRGKIQFASSVSMTFSKKKTYIEKYGNIDDETNSLYLDYRFTTADNDIEAIKISGVKNIFKPGVYSYNVKPVRPGTDAEVTTATNFTSLTWEYSGYGANEGNTIDKTTGVLTIEKVGDSESSEFTGTVRCIITKRSDGEVVKDGQEFPVYLYQRDARVGDYLFADGSYSDEIVPGKTVVGVCFYVDPSNPDRRLAVSTRNLTVNQGSGTQGASWGLYNNGNAYDGKSDNSNMGGLRLSGSSLSDGTDNNKGYIYDIKELPNISGTGLINGQNIINIDNYWDREANDGKGDFIAAQYDDISFGSVYNTDTSSVSGKAGSMIGFIKLKEDLEVDSVSGNIFENEKSISGGKEYLVAGTSVPWGFIQTRYIIHHRDEVLNHVVRGFIETDDLQSTTEIDPDKVGLTPPNNKNSTEYRHLLQLINRVIADAGGLNKWGQVYYPAASLCYAYDPSYRSDSERDTFILNPGEELADHLKAHNWFLPSIGDVARIYWYKYMGDLKEEERVDKAIFAEASRVLGSGFEAFTGSYYWSSTDFSGSSKCFVTFRWAFGGDILGGMLSRGSASVHSVRPVVAF